ncbi:DUF3618 domain-containing protein [Kribbella sp.]|uniref:DUF3618 domain-containing protein n=1 Tax=Kribbella sp. TaxID=1871183 RepID=UPI002D348FA6|nr:DUF3618 domain-containing protein [Kribbella sp.]HZX03307.1 DUF3618 domain-containing protein [Kribbella sp.]
MTTKPTRNAAHREPISETEALRVDLEQTRQHLANTVQQLSQQLNVPHRLKETAGQAGHRAAEVAGQAGDRMKDVPAKVKQMPAMSRQHPKATAVVGGAVAVGVGAAAWMVKRHR